MRFGGASSQSKHSSKTIAAISAPIPAKDHPSSTDTIRPVFLTEAATVAASKGRRLRRSMISAEMPIFSSSSAACRASFTTREKAVIVTCSPVRAMWLTGGAGPLPRARLR